MLILLPLCLLATLGAVSLRQDRLLARHTAAERAREIAESLTPQIWTEILRLAEESSERFCIDSSGKLTFPATAPDREELVGEIEQSGSMEARRLFADSLEHAKAQRLDKAASGFLTVARMFPEATGETGVALKPLAEYKLLELGKAAGTQGTERLTLDLFCSNLVHQPTAMTPFLFSKAQGLATSAVDREMLHKWEHTWGMHEQLRQTYEEASATHSNLWLAPSLIRVGPNTVESSSLAASPGCFLVKTFPSETLMPPSEQTPALPIHAWFAVPSEQELSSRLQQLQARSGLALPSYMAVQVYLGGAPFDRNHKRNPGSQQPAADNGELLAVSRQREGQTDLVRVDVLLTSPAQLFQQQKTRTYWFGALIALSAGAAFFGLAGAWMSFREQAQLNEMKSNFVSSVSHELRAPIASVRLMAENLERGVIPDETKRAQYFRLIGQECRRLSSLIENVLDFSRIEQGRKEYEFEVSDLSRVFSSTLQLMQPMAEQKLISLKQAASAVAVPALKVDGKALQQALVNLVDNAIKHSAKGSTVTAGLDLGSDGSTVNLWVEDHGEGISSSEHEKIFERFYRLGSELRRETQGVGIGLSIVKHVVEAHGGRVDVRSAPGQGSRFTIQLPLDSASRNGFHAGGSD